MKISVNIFPLMLLLLCSSVWMQGREGYQFVECDIIPMQESEMHRSHPHIPGSRSGATETMGNSTSINWSGYVASNNFSTPLANSVSSVSGSWIVPTLKATSNNSYSSIWVGIDGYTSPTVEQIGTSHNWVNGAQQNYAWFEMYPGGSYLISGFPLNLGDVISAVVIYSGNNIFTLVIYNDTQQLYHVVPTSYTTSATALRESAEWIIEAPYLNGVLPLSDFFTAYMWGCMATINGVTAPINNTSLGSRNSWQYRGINMVTTTGAYKDQTSALLLDQGSFFVVWEHE